MTCLWTSFRRHLKVELTILFNDVLLRVLRSPHAPLEKKIIILEQLIHHWFALPANLVELYLNFDNDQVEVSDANIYSGLCEVLCALAEGRLSDGTSGGGHHHHHNHERREAASGEDASSENLNRRHLRRLALDALARVTRCLMDTSATVHLMRRASHLPNGESSSSIDTSPLSKSSGLTPHGSVGWEQDEIGGGRGSDGSGGGDSSLLHRSTNVRSQLEGGVLEVEEEKEDASVASLSSVDGGRDSPSPISADEGELIGGRDSINSMSSNESGESGSGSASGSSINGSMLSGRGRSQSDMGPARLPPMLSPGTNGSFDGGAGAPLSAQSARSRLGMEARLGEGVEGHPMAPMAQRQRQRQRRASVRIRHEQQQDKQKNKEKAIELANQKSLKKALKLLVESGHLNPTPGEFCNWIRDHIDSLDENKLGDYLGEEGKEKVSPSGVVARNWETVEFHSSLRQTYIGGMSFQGVGFVSALRHMLTKSGFRMPGEAQKVSRFLEAFAVCYHEANLEAEGLDTADKCEILAFATVMLNTDQYNPAIKKNKKMTRTQFKRNMRGQGVSDSFLDVVFTDIAAERIAMPIPGQPAPKQKKDKKDKKDHHDDDDDAERGEHSLSLFHRSMQNAAHRARAKLSGHSSMCRVYFTKMSTELVYLMFEISWPFFYRCITVVLDEQEDEEQQAGAHKGKSNGGGYQHLELVACVLDLLRYSISACLCLGMETERRAFAALLAKFHFLHSNSGEWDSLGDVMMFGHEHGGLNGSGSGGLNNDATTTTKDLLSGKHLEQTWFKHVMQTSASDSGAVMDVISEVHQLASRLRDRVMHRHRSKFLKRLCETRFVKIHAEQVLNFNGRKDRSLMKEGVLVRHTQAGREKKYRFFLFSDLFLYASGGGRSKLKVHNYLPLDTLTVKEAPQDSELDALVSFQIESPVKSFAISASSPSKKRAWMNAIESACRQEEMELAEREKKSMMARSGGSGGNGGNSKSGGSSRGATPRRQEKGKRHMMGSKRISMIDRFDAQQLQEAEEEVNKSTSRRRQSMVVSGSGEEKEKPAVKGNEYETMSDQEMRTKFQSALKYSKSILEGTHEVSIFLFFFKFFRLLSLSHKRF